MNENEHQNDDLLKKRSSASTGPVENTIIFHSSLDGELATEFNET